MYTYVHVYVYVSATASTLLSLHMIHIMWVYVCFFWIHTHAHTHTWHHHKHTQTHVRIHNANVCTHSRSLRSQMQHTHSLSLSLSHTHTHTHTHALTHAHTHQVKAWWHLSQKHAIQWLRAQQLLHLGYTTVHCQVQGGKRSNTWHVHTHVLTYWIQDLRRHLECKLWRIQWSQYYWWNHYSCLITIIVLQLSHWIFHVCDMTVPYMWHCPSICVTWLLRMCDMIPPVWAFVQNMCSHYRHLQEVWVVSEQKIWRFFWFCYYKESRDSWYTSFHPTTFKKFGGSNLLFV